MPKTAYLTAGVPTVSATLYWKMRFLVGDPAAVLEFNEEVSFPNAKPSVNPNRKTAPNQTRLLILRDIENERARAAALADYIACPADFAPQTGLSGDREVATAQSVAEAFRRAGVELVISDRTLPLIYVAELKNVGIACECDVNRGIIERRSKDAQELEYIHEAQLATEEAIRQACVRIATASPDAQGRLVASDGELLTSDNMRRFIDRTLLDAGYQNVPSIVAGRKDGGDCHNYGSGYLYTGEPIIIDVFPMNKSTLYNGDCTRTVVHGEIQPIYAKMLEAICAAKAAATATIRAGVDGETVHRATIKALESYGFGYAAPDTEEAQTQIRLTHGTGHGLGLSIHEPPLLDFRGPELVVGDVVSVEPGLYSKEFGGIRVEDIVTVTEDGCVNLGSPLPETLDWLNL
ncbi:MAG: M24 family metallopeptidase [Planctomycetia bacterium]|nr:M24 family metallopeptidase [Planctomycetia bacterium]